jgi:hypothetical protein
MGSGLFSLWLSAAGVHTLGRTLALADIYAEFRSQYPAGTPMAGRPSIYTAGKRGGHY